MVNRSGVFMTLYVLEGIKLIKKITRNRLQWVRETEGFRYMEAASMEKEVEDLDNEEKELNHWIKYMTERLN